MSINFYSGEAIGGWSSEGIIQDSSPGLPVLCNTTHLTSFAILVSSGGSDVSCYICVGILSTVMFHADIHCIINCLLNTLDMYMTEIQMFQVSIKALCYC